MILHLLFSGKTGGIEKLCKDIGMHSPKNHMFCFTCFGGELYEQFVKNKLNTVLLNLSAKNPIRMYCHLIRIVKLSNINTLIVHHDAPVMFIAAIMVKLRLRNVKVFAYTHANFKDLMVNFRYKKQLFFIAGRIFDKIIAISQSVRNSIIEETKIPPDKIVVIYNGIQCSKYFSEHTNEHSGSVKIIYVGRLIKEKGIHILLQALPLLESNIQWSLQIVGDGPYRSELESISKKLGINERVDFLGIQENVPEYLKAADVFVHPAIWEEGFGITIIEAMSSGLICIASKKGALPEIINDKINGFLIENITPQKLANEIETICQMIKNDNLLSVRKAAVNKSQQFTIDQTVKKLEIISK